LDRRDGPGAHCHAGRSSLVAKGYNTSLLAEMGIQAKGGNCTLIERRLGFRGGGKGDGGKRVS